MIGKEGAVDGGSQGPTESTTTSVRITIIRCRATEMIPS